MTKIDLEKAQKEIDELKEVTKHKKKIRAMQRHELYPYIAEILAWAKANGGSRRKIQYLLKAKMGIDIDDQKIYRFVLFLNDGVWPNARSYKNKGAPK